MEKLVIWDYNGTICDDVKYSLSCMNTMLKRRGQKTLSLTRYKEIFGFPVVDYYKMAGFDFYIEPYEELAHEYIELYKFGFYKKTRLRHGAVNVIKEINRMQARQIVLSASELSELKTQLEYFKLIGYFDKVLGSSDIYAHSKMSAAVEYIAKVQPQKILLIGDTLHDAQIADKIGADCLLLSGGHQSRQRLLATGKIVIDNIKKIPGYI